MKLIKTILLLTIAFNISLYAEENATVENAIDSSIALDSNSTSTDDFENEFGDSNATSVDRFDPLEPYNRVMTSFNDKVYIHVLDPTAKAYAKVVPEGGRVAVNRFFKNIQAPVSIANNLLQFKFKNAAQESGRFVVNTVFGLGGFFDPALTDLEWEAHDEDFGQTLGYYGVGDGVPIVIPFLGPSNLRDLTGLVVDGYLNPLRSSKIGNANYKIAQNNVESILYKGGDMFNKASLHVGEYEMIKKDALDLYPFLQDAYSQHQNQLIKE